MLTSLALIFLVGLSLGEICKKLKLPSLIGMLLSGIILGPYVLNFLDSQILGISSELRELALVIILIKAGLSLDINDIKKVGRPAFFMAFIPASFEILSYIIFAPIIFDITILEACIMGTVLAAVSPAVIVPRMVSLMENQKGTKQGIPQLIMASASCDDIFVIVLFSTFLSMAMGENVDVVTLLNIPISILLGILLGAVVGVLVAIFFKQVNIRNSIKIIIILSISFLLLFIEDFLVNYIAISALIAIMTMSIVFKAKLKADTSIKLSIKIGKLWLAAELLLFVLVGASVDITYTLQAGLGAIAIVIVSLIFRGFGVIISLMGTHFTFKEKLFCIIAFLPKATVQAAIGAIPLANGLECGNIVLSVAVVGIMITAPIGAILIDANKDKLLD